MTRQPRLWVYFAVPAAVLIVIVVLFFVYPGTERPPDSLPLTKTFDESPSGFTVRYPEDWDYSIPLLGVMVMGPSATLYNGEPGPTFTVHRTAPLSVMGNLENALEQYLARGPMRVAGRWQITDAITPVQFNGRDALVVELRGSEIENGLPLHTTIIATSADNSFVYLFITTVPVDAKAALTPTFEALLATVRILE